jgi:hypothetical protein
MFIQSDLIKKYRFNHIYMFSKLFQMINLQLALCSFIVLPSDNDVETTNVG